MHILGISAMSHDPAAALVGEPGVIAAIEDGKLARARATEGIPRNAIQYCLSESGAEWKDVEVAAVAGRPGRAWVRQALLRARLAPLSPVSSAYFLNKATGELGRELNNFRILREMAEGKPARVEAFDHHLSHAASSYFASPFERALLVSLDEQGDGSAGFVGIGEGTSIRELSRIPLPHSLGWLFTKATALLGFRPHVDEHKTQWLSLSAEPILTDSFVTMLRRHPQGAPHLNSKYFHSSFAGDNPFSGEFHRALGISRDARAAIPQMSDSARAAIAASLQNACGIVLTDWLESLRKQTGQDSLCLAGGLFLNPLLVSVIERNTGFHRVFVQPAAGNEGTALGAAWLAWHARHKNQRVDPMSAPYWGPTYSNEQIKQVLDNCKAAYRWCDSEDQKIESAVQLLQSGKIVAWFQGRAEFGPRALGNRSLLASPWSPYVKENLNDYVKHREPFRPFALAVPEEDCPEYFDCTPNTRFMTTMATAKEKARQLFGGSESAFISSQGLVRLHAVPRDANPLLWKLLKRCGQSSPAPMLVNTSFNLFGEPLVVSPRDAVRSYYCSGTDALIAGSFLLTKR